jgi:hypothetical protein
MKSVRRLVPVPMMPVHWGEKWKMGPLAAQPRRMMPAATKAHVEPNQAEAREAKRPKWT